MIKLAALALATALGLGLGMSAANADVIYGTTAIGASPRSSDYGTVSGGGYRTFDNFTAASNAAVEKISWRGIWFGDAVPAPAPDPLVDSWEIAFYASGGGLPGAALWTQTVAAASVSSTFRGTGLLTVVSSYNANFYDYSFDLTSAFDVLAGTEYWVSVTAIADNFNPVFAVLGATGGDGESYQQQLGAGMSVVGSQFVDRDRAFTLEGTLLAVPEPAGWALALVALLALGSTRTRRAQ